MNNDYNGYYEEFENFEFSQDYFDSVTDDFSTIKITEFERELRNLEEKERNRNKLKNTKSKDKKNKGHNRTRPNDKL